MNAMTAPIHESQDREARWTAQTVRMSVEILDRMERAVAKVRDRADRLKQILDTPDA
jgi:hypothetical protein